MLWLALCVAGGLGDASIKKHSITIAREKAIIAWGLIDPASAHHC